MSLTTYYPNGLPYIVEERVDGIRKGTVYIYDVKRRLINALGYDYRGQMNSIDYWQNHITRHNTYGPAQVALSIDGQINYISYKQNGLLHNLHGPALIDRSHRALYIEYRQNGLLHNLHGPAYISWYNGKIFRISYRQNGLLHNLYGPACIAWDNNGQIYSIEYRQNNTLHNEHGPSWILWYYNGQIKYCQNDKQFIC